MIELLKKISNEKIVVDINNGELQLFSSQTNIDSDLLSEIKTHKKELIEYLTKNKDLSFQEKEYKEIPKCKESSSYSLSNAQRRLWLASQFVSGANTFNMPNTIFLDGVYDVACFQKAVYSVIDRHEILRTVFKSDERGNVQQYVLTSEELGFSITYQDYKERENPEVEAKSYIKQDSYQPFDLVEGPLIRACLLQLSETKYMFYYNLHHIISDGWSMEVLARDVMQYYKAYVSNQTPEVPLLRIQYKDYAAWQLEQLNNTTYQDHKKHWLNRLSGELPVIDLPSYKIRPKIKTNSGRRLNSFISKDLTNQLNQFIKKNDGSLFMFVLSVINVLIHKYTSAEDIIIGSPFAGRTHPDLEDQIGFYVNILAFRNKIDPEESFIDFYKKVKEIVLDDFSHQEYAFDKLIEDLELKYDQSRSPLSDISFTLHNSNENINSTDIREDILNKIESKGVTISKNDIEFHATMLGDVIALDIIYNDDVYDEGVISNMLQHFKQLLSNLLLSPDEKLLDVDYLTPEECHEILEVFNTNTIECPKDKTIVDLFVEQAKKTPNSVAVVFQKASLTYKELEEKSNQLANCLITEHSVKRGDFVGVHLDRSEQYIVCLLGILKAGAIYVPIDTGYPSGRKEYIINDANIQLLITDTNYMFDLPYFDGALLAIDVEFENFDYNSDIQIFTTPNDLAYVIYTSGSTGEPKGVMIEHKAVLNAILAQIDIYDITSNCKAVQFTSFSFDVSISEIFNILLSGASLFIASEEMRSDPRLLEEYIEDHNINLATLPPSYFQIMKPEKLRGLKKLITGGEPSDYEKVVSLLSDGLHYYNSYGPTETSICVTVFKMTNTNVLDSKVIPIGKPTANTQIFILSESLELMPVGAIGELCIGGSQLALGYLNRPDLTSEKFIENPFRKEEKLYRTGDLARWLPDGNIEFIGRKDHQVKIRGHRIELGEIELVIDQINAIKQSVVVAREDIGGSKQLVAYIISDTELDHRKIQEDLEDKLPEYMVPKIYVSLDKMPLSHNGKVDRKALPIPDEESYNKQEYIAPTNEEEKALISVWESVLGVKGISIKDNFYNLGGDSIKSIQIVARSREHGYTLKVGDVLSMPILENMATLMKKVSKVIDQSEVEGKVALTPIQHILFEHPSIVNPSHFNQSLLLKSHEKLNSDFLKLSIIQLVKHHDVLRMVYHQENNTWIQNNRKYTEECFKIDFHDLSNEKDSLKMMGELCQDLQSNLDLSNGPLFVVGHFRLSDGDRLALICHHLLIDGVSWRILLEDLSTVYKQYQSGKEISLPLKTDSFQKWASLQQEYSQSKELSSEHDYWNNLHTSNIPDFPIEKGVREDKMRMDKRVSFTLDQKITSIMQTSIHDVYHTEINDILLAGLGLALKDTFGICKSVVEMEGHGREDILEDVEINRTVGWFTSIYPLILEVSKSSERSKNLIKVKDNLRKIPNKGIGYGILKHLKKGFSSNLIPAIQFNYLGEFGNKIVEDKEINAPIFEYGSDYIGEAIDPQNIMDALIGVSGSVSSGELSMAISYRSDLYNDKTMQVLIDSYKDNLTSLINELSSINESYLTPSDLTFTDLSFDELQDLNADDLLEDIYELSSAQQGMYYHWFSSEDSYFEQASYRVKGAGLNMAYFKEAYDTLVDRYAILRTSFISQYADSILQVVKKSVPSGFLHIEAPANIEPNNKQAWVEKMKFEDREKGFNLEESSQMRLTILDLDNEEYEFIWSHHHILMDGWCTSILINDFYRILQSIEKGSKHNLSKVNPYSDYIKWLSKLDKEGTMTYWKNYLSGYNNTAKVPYAYSNSSLKEYSFNNETIELTGNIHEKINVLCNELEITPNTFTQVVWGYLLSRYNNTQDVVFGSVVSGRPADLSGAEEMVGLFLNTIPVRIHYSENDTPKDVLKKTQEEAIACLPYHYASLSSVQGQSELGVSLLDHIMIFENYPIQELIEEQLEEKSDHGSSTLEFESVDINGRTNYDFNIAVAISETYLKVHFQYNKNRYEEILIKKLATHFYNIVQSFTEQSDLCLKEIDYLTKEEKHELLHSFNPINVEYPKDKTIVDVFKEQVYKTPDAIAVVFKEKTLTYEELDTKSNQLAHYLKRKGVKTEDLVGICLDKSLEMIVSVLAVLKSGGTYIPIDPEYPEDRINYIIEDSHISFFVTNSEYNYLVRDNRYTQVILIDKDCFKIRKESIESIDHNYSSEQAVYVVYTSGSTGKPKGVVVSHSGLLNIALSWKKEYELNSKTSLLQMVSFSFDVFSGDLCRGLLFGGKIILCPPETRLDLVALYKIISKWNINIIEMTPALAIELMDYIYENELDVSWMNLLILGSDILQTSDYQRLVSRFGSTLRIVNSYGTTETTIDSSFFETDSLNTLNDLPYVPIGKPMQNTSFYVLDKQKRLLPAGVVGELYIGGAGLAKEYLNQEDLTVQKFVEHPFKKEERIYKTGDFARWLPDGNMDFIGRKDHQVKVRGYRIELGEIESVLEEIKEISKSVVLAKENSRGIHQLIAYLILDEPIDNIIIQQNLRKKLPEYMIPRVYIPLDTMPITVNGKIDRKALSVINLDINKEYAEPSSETEIKLVQIWKEVLEIDKIGINDNFFDLGGNSISAIRIILGIRRELDIEIDIKSLFEFNTIADLALHMDFSIQQEQIISKSEIVKQIM
ncbi:non-ribosomal peptide synthetase [Aquimarina muelleri]|uniref:Non-ribosomal peptide synthetase n=1 Tax=Aquimarina muelleri TaxID=279356 RepID=A0A918JX93_9FLAO|nr:non-ribosomal peptide synthetase [Aquimarina muelleri]MCX2762225.1 non-ribosomal peptide synthetase [Aquimarina muelleri]GGX16505.1 non-ribosomal peptide synthetase [Aquimarina muelleri]